MRLLHPVHWIQWFLAALFGGALARLLLICLTLCFHLFSAKITRVYVYVLAWRPSVARDFLLDSHIGAHCNTWACAHSRTHPPSVFAPASEAYAHNPVLHGPQGGGLYSPGL